MNADETRAEWVRHAESVARRQRDGAGPPGLTDRTTAAGLSGFEFLQAMLAGRLPPSHIGHTLAFTLVEVQPGKAVFQGTPALAHYNPIGSVHGGWFATLLDSAMGCAVQTTLPAGRAYTTAELSVNIVRAATRDTGPLRAIGQVIHSGRQLATAEARLIGPDGKLYAHGTTTCLVFEATRPPATPTPAAA